MVLTKIELTNFRNYKTYQFTPNEGLNIITGSNGIGKTNLVEAIYYLNLARGFKNKKDVSGLETSFLILRKDRLHAAPTSLQELGMAASFGTAFEEF